MKRRSVQRAYENIRPDEEARVRMLENILSEASEIPPAGKDERTMRKRVKPLIIVAVIVAMVMLMGCAVIVMNLQDLVIGERTSRGEILDSEGNVVVETEVVRNVISLQGIKESPNQLAAQEWFEFEESYDVDGQKIGEAEAAGYVAPREYDAYFVYDQTMQDKVDEIAQKYGLKLAGAGAMAQTYQNDILFDALGFENLHHEDASVEVEYLGGYFYACGNFNMEFFLTLTGDEGQWPHEILANMRYNGKEYLDTVFASIANIEDVEQWNYTTANGTDILIIMSKDHARFFCDREDAFLTSSFRTDYESDSGEIEYMSKRDVELVADTLDFDVVPKQPDMETVEQKLAESEAEMLENQKPREEYGYQDFIANRIEALEHPENLYYTLIDIDQNGVVDLLLGSKEQCEVVWTIAYDENAGYEHMNFVPLSDEEWTELNEAWPTMEIYPITTYPMESVKQDKYGYQSYIDEVLAMEHPENTLFVLYDINNDGTLELLIGDQEQLSFVFRVKYDKNGYPCIEVLSVSMAEDEWNTLSTAWPGMERKPVTEYYSE